MVLHRKSKFCEEISRRVVPFVLCLWVMLRIADCFFKSSPKAIPHFFTLHDSFFPKESESSQNIETTLILYRSSRK